MEQLQHVNSGRGEIGGGSSPADTSGTLGATPSKGSYQTWITTMRIVLCFMLVAYHNHRIFDSYRHNISIEPFEWEDAAWVRSMVKSTQRAILQAGLNVFMLISGMAAFYSFRKRRNNLLSQLQQRTIKLLLGYAIGVILVIIPSRFFLQFCGVPVTLDALWDFFSLSGMVGHFADGQHIGYLPYLFVLTQLYSPVNVCALNAADLVSGPAADGLAERKAASRPPPIWWSGCGVVYTLLLIMLSPWLMICSLVALAIVAGPAKTLGTWKMLAANTYRPVHLGKGLFTQTYPWIFPLLWAAIFWMYPAFEYPPGSMILTQIIPLAVCFLPFSSVTPFPRAASFFSINIPLLSLMLTAVGQIWMCGEPTHMPQPDLDTDFLGIMGARSLGKLLLMFFAHSSFFYLGFFLLLWVPRLPELPYRSHLFQAFICCLVIVMAPLVTQPSKDFFFITAGYATYHSRWRRILYHFGSWFWITAMLLGFMNAAPEEPMEGKGVTKAIARFLRDTTFGVFLCHPMMGFFITCLIKDMEIGLHWKVVILDVGAYVLTYAWSYGILYIKLVRDVFGVKWD